MGALATAGALLPIQECAVDVHSYARSLPGNRPEAKTLARADACNSRLDGGGASDWLALSAGPSDELASREQRQLVQQAIGEAGCKRREAIELAFFDGMTRQETAAKTGVPLGTIKGRIRRALEQIRNHLHVDLRD